MDDDNRFVFHDIAPPGSVRGKLLLAGPNLLDPNFFRTVVLVLDHDEQGAFGLVVNRRSEIPLVNVLERWAPFARPDSYVYLGGPVAPEAGFALARAASNDLTGVSPLRDGWAVVDLEADPTIVGPELTQLRIFSGYAGWGPGQLDAELMADGGWIVVDAHPGDPFSLDTDDLWSAVLRRQRGPLARLANYPVEPRFN
jgi:putative transcriptional regulator